MHAILKNQIQQYLKHHAATSPELKAFLKSVSKTYATFDKERAVFSKNNRFLEESRIATINLLEDFSEKQRELEEAKAKDEAVLESIGQGVVAVDKNGKIVVMNKVAEELLGIAGGSWMGESFVEVASLEDSRGHKVSAPQQLLVLNKTLSKITTSDYFFIREDGTKFPAAITTTPVILHEESIGVIIVFRDISKENEISKAKAEFVSLAAHQLRSPLTTVSWYVEMLLSGEVGNVDPKQKEYLDEIYKGNRRIVALVNTFLNVSRFELGTFVIKPEPTNVIKLAKKVIDELKFEIDQKKIKLHTRFDAKLPLVKADPKMLEQVFQNLLSNSITYTPDKGTIGLHVRFVKAGGQTDKRKIDQDSIAITISDSGYGIPLGQQEEIFTKLFRATNIQIKNTKGSGLGLYIVKAIIDQSNGKIWFKSEENKGTTFYIVLPLTAKT